jgi:gas vesicle protein
MTRNINNVKGFLIGFLAGGTVGAIIALLTAPKSGKELRGDIKQKSEEYYDEAEKYLADAKNKANELINDAKSKSQDILNAAGRVFKDAKAKTTGVINSGKEKIETETERLKSSVKDGIDAYNEAKNS